MISSNKKIGGEIEGLSLIGEFAIASAEIAANSMRQIRDSVVKRRDFLQELTELYNEVKRSYRSEVVEIEAKKKSDKIESVKKSGVKNKKVRVLFSTNTTLYGSINKNTFDLFSQNFAAGADDCVVIGKVGKRMFEESYPKISYSYFDFPDKAEDSDKLKRIAAELIKYDEVVVFHTKFQSLVKQQPEGVVLSEKNDEPAKQVEARKYIFEPSLIKIIDFFEKEIFGSIFEQTTQEAKLSKTASRMVTLDNASQNVKRKLEELRRSERIFKHELMNKDQVNAMTRNLMWRRRSG